MFPNILFYFITLFLQAEPKAAESGPQEGLVRVAGQSTGILFHYISMVEGFRVQYTHKP